MAKQELENNIQDVEGDETNQTTQGLKQLTLQLETLYTSYSFMSDDVHSQDGKTCYAYAAATVLRAAESRIIGRKLKPHSEEVNLLVKRWGSDGANVAVLYLIECPKRQLRYRAVNVQQANKAIIQNRTLHYSFHLDDSQWNNFCAFFKENPTEVLTREDVGPLDGISKTEGHGMALFGVTKDYWILKNSWGEWGDKGYCKIGKDAIDNVCLYDIFYYQSDLTADDWANYKKYDRKKCNAKSITTVIRAAERRIIGRKVKKFSNLKREILTKIKKSESIDVILEAECGRRKLRFNKSDVKKGVEGTIDESRPRIGVLQLSESNWCKFVRIFIDDAVDSGKIRNERGIRTFCAMSAETCNVVITEINGSQYRIKNPWSDPWKDKGKLIELDGINVTLYDVYFYQHELTKWDWINYHNQITHANLKKHHELSTDKYQLNVLIQIQSSFV